MLINNIDNVHFFTKFCMLKQLKPCPNPVFFPWSIKRNLSALFDASQCTFCTPPTFFQERGIWCNRFNSASLSSCQRKRTLALNGYYGQHTQCTWYTVRTCTCTQYNIHMIRSALYAPAPCFNTGSIVIPWYRLVTQLRNRCALKQTTTGGLLILDHGPTDFRVCSAARTKCLQWKKFPCKACKGNSCTVCLRLMSWYFSLIWFW